MVSAGGGGAGATEDSFLYSYGGSSGGINGYSGLSTHTSSSYLLGAGGTQIIPGNNTYATPASINIPIGAFGKGGSNHGDITYCTSGGGGGYYGGSGGPEGLQPGGGGSSFISGYAGVNAIDINRKHTYNTVHYSNKIFLDSIMRGGVNENNGSIRVTYLGNKEPVRINTKLNNVQYIKDCSTGNAQNGYVYWNEIQAIDNTGINVAFRKNIIDYTESAATNYSYSNVTNGYVSVSEPQGAAMNNTSGINRCITIDLGKTYNLNEIAVWHLADDVYSEYQPHYNNYIQVSSDNSNWTTIKASESISEDTTGKRINAFTKQLFISNPKGGTLYVENISRGIAITVNSNQNGSIAVSNNDSIKITATPNSNFSLVSLKNGDINILSGTIFNINSDNLSISSSWKRNDYFMFLIDSYTNIPFSITQCHGSCASMYTSMMSSSRHYYYYETKSQGIRLDAISNSSVDLTDFSQACTWAYTSNNASYITSDSKLMIGVINSRSSWLHESTILSTTPLPIVGTGNPIPELCVDVSSVSGSKFVGLQLLQYTSQTVTITTYVHYVVLRGQTYQ